MLANDLYHQLTQEGLKVFFSRITLEDKIGEAYEPYIFAALNSAKVMVVLGTRPEYFKAVWVRNEWSRFLSQIKAGAKKSLVPAYKDMDPYDLPDEFSNLQAQDMSKLGFMQDLIRGIKKLTEVEDKSTLVVKETTVINNAVNTDSEKMVKRAMLALEDNDFVKADEFAEKALDLDPENPNAYLVKLLVECKIQKPEDLINLPNPFDGNSNFKKVIRFADKNLKDRMNGYVEERRKYSIYKEAVSYISDTSVDSNKKAIELFESILDFRDSKDKYLKCEYNLKLIPYKKACELMNNNSVDDNYKAIKIFDSLRGFKDSKDLIINCEINIMKIHYKEACRLMSNSSIDSNQSAIKIFESIIDFEDSREKINQCNFIINSIKEKEERKRILAEQLKKAKTFGVIFFVILLLITLFVLKIASI